MHARIRPPAGATLRPALGRARRPISRARRLHRRRPALPGVVLQGRNLPAADAAGLRSRPSVPVDLEPQQELRGEWSGTAAAPSSRASRCRGICRASSECRRSPTPGSRTFAFLEDVIRANLGELFPGVEVVGAHLFRVIRDTDIEMRRTSADDLLESVDRAQAAASWPALAAAGRSDDAAARAEHAGRELRGRRRHRRPHQRAARVLRLDGAAPAAAAAPEGRAVRPAHAVGAVRPRHLRVRRHPRAGLPGPPSVRLVLRGRDVPAQAVDRSARGRHQDDAVSDRRELAADRPADRRGGRRASRWRCWSS